VGPCFGPYGRSGARRPCPLAESGSRNSTSLRGRSDSRPRATAEGAPLFSLRAAASCQAAAEDANNVLRRGAARNIDAILVGAKAYRHDGLLQQRGPRPEDGPLDWPQGLPWWYKLLTEWTDGRPAGRVLRARFWAAPASQRPTGFTQTSSSSGQLKLDVGFSTGRTHGRTLRRISGKAAGRFFPSPEARGRSCAPPSSLLKAYLAHPLLDSSCPRLGSGQGPDSVHGCGLCCKSIYLAT